MKASTQNLFGTDGIRNKVGNYPLTPDALPKLGRAIALWAQEKYGDKASFLLASDTRYSGPWIKTQLASGLLSTSITVYDAQILPTPALFHLIKENPLYTCGIMISASHNPAEDNGIKLIDARTGKLTPEDERRISYLMMHDNSTLDYHALGNVCVSLEAEAQYAHKIISLFSPLLLKGLKVVLDCANGATYKLAPAIFNALGAETIVIHADPTGYNINKDCGALHLESLQKEVIKHKATLGFAFDGDGDRVMAVNNKGEVKDGDDILTLLQQHPSYQKLPALVSTIMANQGFEVQYQSIRKRIYSYGSRRQACSRSSYATLPPSWRRTLWAYHSQ